MRAKKSFGQHFLIDDAIIQRIVESADIQPNEQVVEIGPGRGALTRHLPQERLTLVELDRDLIDTLKQDCPSAEVVHADATRVNYATIADGSPWVLIGNLPYNVGNAIVMQALQTGQGLQRCIVMVQREVAERMMAPPGSNRGVLSVAMQLYGDPVQVTRVKPGSFQPPPRVESTVVKMEIAPKTTSPEAVLRLVKDGFSARRKQLQKTLAGRGYGSSKELKALLESLNIRSDIRPQDLTTQQWIDLFQALNLS